MIKLALVVFGLAVLAGFGDALLPHDCRWCGRPFPNRAALNRHLKHYRHD